MQPWPYHNQVPRPASSHPWLAQGAIPASPHGLIPSSPHGFYFLICTKTFLSLGCSSQMTMFPYPCSSFSFCRPRRPAPACLSVPTLPCSLQSACQTSKCGWTAIQTGIPSILPNTPAGSGLLGPNQSLPVSTQRPYGPFSAP